MKHLKQYGFAKDLSNKFLFCNENFAEVADLDSPHQIIGKKDCDLIWREMAEKYLRDDDHVIKGNRFINQLEDHPQKDRVAKVLITKNQLLDGEGQCVGVIGVSVDVTDWKMENKICHFDHVNRSYVLQGELDGVSFSEIQFQVLKKLVRGHTAPEIAREIHRSPRTVEDHISEIKYKLHCSHKGHIIEAAYRYGFIFDLIFDDN